MNAIQGLRDQALKFQSQLSQGTLNSIDMFQFHQQTAETQRSFFNNDQRRRFVSFFLDVIYIQDQFLL